MAEYPVRLRWCLAVGAPVIATRGGDLRELGGWDREGIARARGEDEIMAATTSWLAELGLTDRATLMAWCRERLEGKRELSRVIAVLGWATWAGWIGDTDTTQALLLTGALAQRQYGSWDELGAATSLPISEGVRALWATLPWATPLEVTILEPPARLVLRGTCPHCSAPRVRPSSHAFVYCDYCGELADYDFVTACRSPRRPGPAYEALREQLDRKIMRARDLNDREQFRELQLELFGAWLDSTPEAAPVRTKLPEYRAQYIAWLAEAATTIAFDMDARRAERGMQRAVEKLTFAEVEGRDRVAGFPALLDAMSEFEARVDAISADVYAMHPDHASRELQRRIGFSQFAQAWLPFLGEDEATDLLKRTMLEREYDPVGTVATTKWPCSQCGGAIELVEGARRVCCDHCGRIVAVTG